jgi:hypothetical protein
MKLSIVNTSVVLTALCVAASTEAQEIAVGANVQVSAARADISHNEVVLAADPNDARRLLACSMVIFERATAVNSAAYVSFDGGKTWTAPIVTDSSFANDPTCAYGPDGTAYFIAKTVTRPPRSGSDWDALYIYRASDGGRHWDLTKSIASNDRPFMAVDTTRGPNRGRLYVAFNHHIHGEAGGHTPDDYRNTTRLATSLDGGRTFPYIYDRAQFDQGGAITSASNVGATVVMRDGTVAAVQMHALMTVAGSTTGKQRATRTWLQLFVSTDGGESLEPARKVADIESSYNQANIRTVASHMAVDTSSGRFADRLYVAWADVRSGRSEIMLSHSDDKGKTWSTPRVVSDDRPATPPAQGPDDFMATVAVNKAGIVGVQWYDRRDNPDNEAYYTRFAASLDGGDTWLPSVRVSEAPNSRASARKGSYFLVTGGDTAGLVADADGVFHSLWIDNRTGVQQVWTAPIRVRTP